MHLQIFIENAAESRNFDTEEIWNKSTEWSSNSLHSENEYQTVIETLSIIQV